MSSFYDSDNPKFDNDDESYSDLEENFSVMFGGFANIQPLNLDQTPEIEEEHSVIPEESIYIEKKPGTNSHLLKQFSTLTARGLNNN
jgi:hypothetical protein